MCVASNISPHFLFESSDLEIEFVKSKLITLKRFFLNVFVAPTSLSECLNHVHHFLSSDAFLLLSRAWILNWGSLVTGHGPVITLPFCSLPPIARAPSIRKCSTVSIYHSIYTAETTSTTRQILCPMSGSPYTSPSPFQRRLVSHPTHHSQQPPETTILILPGPQCATETRGTAHYFHPRSL